MVYKADKNTEEPVKTAKPTQSSKKKKSKGGSKTLSVIIIALLLVFGGLLAFYFSKIGLIQFSDGKINGPGISPDGNYEDESDMQNAVSGLVSSQPIFAEGEIKSDKDILNILLLGTDERDNDFSDKARADACMVLSINKKTMDVKLISFERGMGMKVPYGNYEGQFDWLTHLFNYGGADMMMQAISDTFKIEVNHYIRVNFLTFEEIINSVGGVDLELTAPEASAVNEMAGEPGKLSAGANHLDGYEALQYSRLRAIDSDWKRIERQRTVIAAVVAGTQGMGVMELNSLLNDTLPLVQTNFSKMEITMLLPLLLKYSDVNIEQMTIPQSGTYGSMTGMGGRSMFSVNFADNSILLQNLIYG